MKILLSWLEEFINLQEYSIPEISFFLTNSGLEVDSIENIRDYDCLKNLVVGEIIECEQHPNADRLKCVKVNIGNKILNIVCGASNARTGIKVIVAQNGTEIKTFSGEKIKIKTSKIREEVSEGMLCAEDEIGISDNHEKIIEIDEKYPVGTIASDVYNLKNEYCLDVDLTPNRWYSASHFGISRDLLAKINFHKKTNKSLKKIDFECTEFKSKLKPLNNFNIEIDDKNICKRYSGLLFKNIEIKESPKIIKERLKELGINPINNIVDITNYIMLEFGQPLHAYDFDKINGKIIIREAKKGEKIKALNDNVYSLEEDIVICDNAKILSLAGVIGGKDSAISPTTKNIFFESASFDNTKILKTTKRLKITTEASLRFSHFINPEMQFFALQRVYDLLKNQQDNLEVEGYIDLQNENIKRTCIRTSFDKIDQIIGQKIKHDDVLKILNDLEINVIKIDDDVFDVVIPAYRYNIQNEADIVDEILRIYGYENLMCDSDNSLILCKKNNFDYENILEIEKKISTFLVSNGFYEIKTNSLIEKKFDINNENIKAIELANAASNKFEILRQSLLFSGLEVLQYNINHGNVNLKLFEFGKIYFENNKNENIEENHIGIYMCGNYNNSWREKIRETTFFDLKNIVLNILKIFNIENIKCDNIIDTIFNSCISVKEFDKTFLKMGAVNETILKNFEIKNQIFFADINFDLLCRIIKNIPQRVYHEIINFPIVKRDLSLIIDKNVKYEDIVNIISNLHEKNIVKIELFSIYEQIENNKKVYSISILLQNKQKTLENDDIQNIMDKIIFVLKKKINLEIREK